MIAELYNRAKEFTLTEKQREAFDLLQSIQTYRAYPSIDQVLKKRSNLVHQLGDVEKLWRQFGRMTKQDLADLAMRLINEIW